MLYMETEPLVSLYRINNFLLQYFGQGSDEVDENQT